MELSEFLLLINKATQLEGLHFNADGVCRLCVERTIVVELKWQEDKGVWLSTGLADVHQLSHHQVLTLLQANAYGQGVGNGQLALKSFDGEVGEDPFSSMFSHEESMQVGTSNLERTKAISSKAHSQVVYQSFIDYRHLTLALFIERFEALLAFRETWKTRLQPMSSEDLSQHPHRHFIPSIV